MVLTEQQLNDIVFEAVLEEFFDPDPDLLEEGLLDWVQGTLDVVGLIPGIGEGADAVNAIIGLVKGDFIEASFSAISMIPMAGDAVGKTGKLIWNALEPFMPWIQKFIDGAVTIWDVFAKYGRKLWDVMKGMWDKLKPIRDFAVKGIDQVKKFFNMIKTGSAKKLDSFLGDIIPDVAYDKVDSVLKKVSGMMDGVGEKIQGFMDWISKAEEVMDHDEMPEQIPEEGGAEPGSVTADGGSGGGDKAKEMEKTLSGAAAPQGDARKKAISDAGTALGKLGFSDIKNVAIKAVKAVQSETNEAIDYNETLTNELTNYSLQYHMVPKSLAERQAEWNLIGKTIREGCDSLVR